MKSGEASEIVNGEAELAGWQGSVEDQKRNRWVAVVLMSANSKMPSDRRIPTKIGVG